MKKRNPTASPHVEPYSQASPLFHRKPYQPSLCDECLGSMISSQSTTGYCEHNQTVVVIGLAGKINLFGPLSPEEMEAALGMDQSLPGDGKRGSFQKAPQTG